MILDNFNVISFIDKLVVNSYMKVKLPYREYRELAEYYSCDKSTTNIRLHSLLGIYEVFPHSEDYIEMETE